jgi:hypothetical protein
VSYRCTCFLTGIQLFRNYGTFGLDDSDDLSVAIPVNLRNDCHGHFALPLDVPQEALNSNVVFTQDDPILDTQVAAGARNCRATVQGMSGCLTES